MKHIPFLFFLLLSLSGWVACNNKTESNINDSNSTANDAAVVNNDSTFIDLDAKEVKRLCEALRVKVIDQQMQAWKISDSLDNDLKKLDSLCNEYTKVGSAKKDFEKEGSPKQDSEKKDSTIVDSVKSNKSGTNETRTKPREELEEIYNKIKTHLSSTQSTVERDLTPFSLVMLLVIAGLVALIGIGLRRMRAEGKLMNVRPKYKANSNDIKTPDWATQEQVKQLKENLDKSYKFFAQLQQTIQELQKRVQQLENQQQQFEMNSTPSAQQLTTPTQQLLYFTQPTFEGTNIVFRGGHQQPTAQDCWVIDTITGEVTLNPSSFSFSLPRAKEFLAIFADILNLNQVSSPTLVDYIAKGCAQDQGNGTWLQTQKMKIRLL